jgi:adenine specific DNA methylase Mod
LTDGKFSVSIDSKVRRIYDVSKIEECDMPHLADTIVFDNVIKQYISSRVETPTDTKYQKFIRILEDNKHIASYIWSTEKLRTYLIDTLKMAQTLHKMSLVDAIKKVKNISKT